MGHLEPSGAIWRNLESSGVTGITWDNLEQSGAIWSHLEASGVIWSHLEPSGAIGSHLEPSGAIAFHFRGNVVEAARSAARRPLIRVGHGFGYYRQLCQLFLVVAFYQEALRAYLSLPLNLLLHLRYTCACS